MGRATEIIHLINNDWLEPTSHKYSHIKPFNAKKEINEYNKKSKMILEICDAINAGKFDDIIEEPIVSKLPKVTLNTIQQSDLNPDQLCLSSTLE